MKKERHKLCKMGDLQQGDRFYFPGKRETVYQVFFTDKKLRYGKTHWDARRAIRNTADEDVVFLRNVNEKTEA